VYVRRVLVGREREMARFTALVEAARNGTAGCVVVRGEPGIGTSVLIDEAVAAVGEATVLRTQGLEVEAPLAFAALHRLLRPLDRLRGQLPGPQARALRVAFGEEDGTSVEPFLIGVATLSLLTAAAEESLVVCVVDDAHWLDAATAAALLFSARRLGADRVAMVFAAREGEWAGFDPQGLAEIVLTGLDDQASRALLADRWGEAPAIAVTDRLIAETRGNPLALVELPSELTPSQLQGTSELAAQLHLTDRVEQVFLDRSRRLPATVQSVLLLAAADDTGDLDTIRRASNRLGLPEAALPEAVASGLLVSDATSCSVRHPLVRSAIYQAATASERRQVHLALAEVLAGSGDPDRETWHRAFAAEGPDQSLVSALELVGTRALRRGGYVAALAAYERAAGLSTDQAQAPGSPSQPLAAPGRVGRPPMLRHC
jgi:predicted ATPase